MPGLLADWKSEAPSDFSLTWSERTRTDSEARTLAWYEWDGLGKDFERG